MSNPQPPNAGHEEEDGGTFKLRPGGGSAGQKPQQPSPPKDEPMDSTMKISRVGGSGAAPPPPQQPQQPPQGNFPGAGGQNQPSSQQQQSPPPAHPTTAIPPQHKTGFAGQPPQQPPQQQQQFAGGGQPGFHGQPGGAPGHAPQAQQPLGQAPGQPTPPKNGSNGLPKTVNLVSQLALISGGTGIVYSLVKFIMATGLNETPFFLFLWAWVYLATSAVVLAIGFLLPKGTFKSKRMRTYAVGVFGAHGLIGLNDLFTYFQFTNVLPTWFLALGTIMVMVITGAVGYGMYLMFTKDDFKQWAEGAPASPGEVVAQGGAVPPPGQHQQSGGYPQHGGYPPQGGHPGQQPPYSR